MTFLLCVSKYRCVVFYLQLQIKLENSFFCNFFLVSHDSEMLIALCAVVFEKSRYTNLFPQVFEVVSDWCKQFSQINAQGRWLQLPNSQQRTLMILKQISCLAIISFVILVEIFLSIFFHVKVFLFAKFLCWVIFFFFSPSAEGSLCKGI